VVLVGAEVPSVAFAWQPARLATVYDFVIAKDAAFAEPLVSESAPRPGQTWRPGGPGVFYWRVRARDMTGGEWSAARRLDVRLDAPKVHDAATIVSVGAGAQLVASSIAFAQSYEWQVASDDRFAAIDAREQTKAPRLIYRGRAAGAMRFRVRAIASGAAPSAWSDTGKLSVEAPFEAPPASAPASEPASVAASDPAPLITVAPPPSAPASTSVVSVPPPPPRAPVALGLRFGASVGLSTNFTASVAPSFAIDAGYALPYLQRRFVPFVRVDYRYARMAAPGPPAATAHAHSVVFAPGLRFEQAVRMVQLYVGVSALIGVLHGLVVSPAFPALASTRAGFGVDGVLGVALALGPGAAFFETRYGWLTQKDVSFVFDAGGFAPSLGYRLSL
jgi:hypothetical protein